MKKIQKKKWGKPKLIVLIKEASVECLAIAPCKTGFGGMGNPSGGDIQCMQTVATGPCLAPQCDTLAAS